MALQHDLSTLCHHLGTLAVVMSDAEPLPYEQRARSFGTIAEHYDRYRPAPPAEALEWVLPEHCQAAVELGAGTGALTELLHDRVREVVAVEPDSSMRQVLVARVAGVPVVGALAEALPLMSGRFDAAVAASSWHWMDPVRTPVEVARVLRPGGALGLLWNGADRSVDWVQEILGPGNVPREVMASRLSERHKPDFSGGAPFHDLESHAVAYSLHLGVDQMVGLMGSYSRVFTLPDEKRQPLLDRVSALTTNRLAETGLSTIELPMRCLCWRAIRD
jgi:SAM-dependent methyltransferase